MTNDNANLAYLVVPISSWMLSIAQIQSYLTLIASLVAIVSGIFAVRYYIKATNKIK